MTAKPLDAARERLRPHVERARNFTGWLNLPTPRPLGPDKPWDYTHRAQQLLASLSPSPNPPQQTPPSPEELQKSSSVPPLRNTERGLGGEVSPSPSTGRGPGGGVRLLDLGTGGGERFAELLATNPSARAVATEEWHVNAPIAAATLQPHHASVVHCTSLQIPFADARFDLILSRHESISPPEIARTLRPGGAFLTQQTWRWLEELHYYIPRTTNFGDHFNGYGSGLHAAGLTIVDARQHVLLHAFDSLEDLVYLLCITPWEIPNFDPLGQDLQPLLALERDLTTPDGLTLTCGHYIIEAHKPA